MARVIALLLPSEYGAYFEPFLGGASVFFALEPKDAHLSDANEQLVATYAALRDSQEEVVRHLKRLRFDAEVYARVRRSKPRADATRAARLIYLNRTAFNGIYRVNGKGEFNVPFGSFTKEPTICDEERLSACASSLATAKAIRTADFERAVEGAAAGDLAYFDPPYITGHLNNGFVKWNAKLFTWDDQERLARVARTLKARGVHVLLSNADHPLVTDLYSGFHRYRLERTSRIGGPVSSRRRVTETLISSYPILGYRSP